MLDRSFWRGRSVFLTGHTGFKGSWLSLWLHALGAKVTGYALDPPTRPSLFEQAGVGGADPLDPRRHSRLSAAQGGDWRVPPGRGASPGCAVCRAARLRRSASRPIRPTSWGPFTCSRRYDNWNGPAWW